MIRLRTGYLCLGSRLAEWNARQKFSTDNSNGCFTGGSMIRNLLKKSANSCHSRAYRRGDRLRGSRGGGRMHRYWRITIGPTHKPFPYPDHHKCHSSRSEPYAKINHFYMSSRRGGRRRMTRKGGRSLPAEMSTAILLSG